MSNHSFVQLLAKWRGHVPLQLAPPPYDGRDVYLTNLVEHTSQVQEGSCFVARVRTGSDGHPYIAPAIARGAKLIIGQRPLADLDLTLPRDVVYWRVDDTAATLAWLAAAWHDFPSQQLTVIGVTGTDGKTSTCNMLWAILQAAGHRVGLISTIKAVIGDHEEPTGLHVSTPEAPAVQRYLQRMVEAGTTHCILETTSHGLAQHRVSAVDFNVGIVTNITHEHLDYHGDYAAYVAAKRRLLEMVAYGSPDQTRALILNRDDAAFAQLAAVPVAHQLHYGLEQPAPISATNIAYAAETTRFDLHLDAQTTLPIATPLVGRFNVYNMLAAAAAAAALGVDPQHIQRGLAQVAPISGRMQRIEAGQPFTVMVDFAHTPNALQEALRAARPLATAPDGRIIAVFGSAGQRDVEKRRLMAEIAAREADLTILTAEDPRTESLADILEMMAGGCRTQGGREGETFWRVPDRGRAIYRALTLAQPADVVLICGKGHEQSMNFGGTEYPWDDREATRAALTAWLAGRPMVDLGLPTF